MHCVTNKRRQKLTWQE